MDRELQLKYYEEEQKDRVIFNTRYREVMELFRGLSYKEIVDQCNALKDEAEGELWEEEPPPDLSVIEAAETKLQRSLPPELREFFVSIGSFHGPTGEAIVEDIESIVRDNLDMWSEEYDDLYMSTKSMFAFGGPGNGDRYFFGILPNGEYQRGEVFLWDHENDSRSWFANSIKDMIIKYYVTAEQEEARGE